jgi:transposase
VLGTETFPTTAVGYRRLERWCSGFGAVTQVGVEGTSSYGRGLCDHLISAGFEVIEVVRPNRQQRRRHGKSDPADAIAAARAVLSGEADSHPKLHGGPVEAIRALHIARASAVKARTQAIVQLHHLIITGPNSIRRQLEPLSNLKRARACAAWRPDMTGASTEAIRYAMRTLARRWLELGQEVDDLTHQLDRLTQQAAPTLRSLSGVGVDTAARLLITAGDNPDRLHNEAAFAALCGTSPVDASSGRQQRHRLNRGGDRRANNALWRIALVRMAHDPTTRAYVQRRLDEGLTKKEILRCLKRYIARQTHRALLADLAPIDRSVRVMRVRSRCPVRYRLSDRGSTQKEGRHADGSPGLTIAYSSAKG